MGHNNKIITLYFNYKGRPSTSVLPFYITDDDGRHYRPKHVAVDVINEGRYNNLGNFVFH